MSTGTVEEVSSTDATFQKLINDQLEDQRRSSAEFAKQFAENRERLALAMDEAKGAKAKVTHPQLVELSQLLSQNPALIQPTLNFAKNLVARVQNAVAAELAKTVVAVDPGGAN